MKNIGKYLSYILLSLILMLNGCSSNKVENHLKLEALSYAISYLNCESGYDASLNYELKCFVKSKDSTMTRLCVVYENDQEIFKFTIQECGKNVIGAQFFDYDGHHFMVSRFFDFKKSLSDVALNNDDLIDFIVPLYEESLNKSLYLEDIKKINISPFTKTDEDLLLLLVVMKNQLSLPFQ